MAKKTKQPSSKVWSMLSVGSAMLAATVVKQLLDGLWRLATGKKPPQDLADPEVSGREAFAWAIVSASAIAAARMFANRKAAQYYTKSTGKVPPGVGDSSKSKASASA
ncbi:MAG: DUF4235 domain-containing protein [Marmoricola sp.]